MKHYYKQAFQALILIIVLTQTSCKKASQEEPITQTEAITPELKTKEINPGENHLKDVEQPVVINNTQSKATEIGNHGDEGTFVIFKVQAAILQQLY